MPTRTVIRAARTWVIKCDGQDHTSGPGSTDRTVSLARLGAKTELVTHKSDGVVTATYTRVLVDDDHTLVSIGRDSEGTIEWVRVFEKQ